MEDNQNYPDNEANWFATLVTQFPFLALEAPKDPVRPLAPTLPPTPVGL